jgi:hypothetical protein
MSFHDRVLSAVRVKSLPKFNALATLLLSSKCDLNCTHSVKILKRLQEFIFGLRYWTRNSMFGIQRVGTPIAQKKLIGLYAKSP